jgi:CubicO group peptidase (beta-lactamase class C family)
MIRFGFRRAVRCAASLAVAFAAVPAGADSFSFDDIRDRIRDALAEENLPSIAVAVARDGKVLWEEGFGLADKERRIPATADTVYSLASISKPVTTTALMLLVERGKIDLDAPMNRYLGEAKLVARVGDANAATVRRVANHTSGLAVHYQFYYEDERVALPTMEQSIRRHGVLVTKPGEVESYSNFGYGLLEYAIERASGKTYSEFVRTEVFAPLGMTHSGVNREPNFGVREAVRYAVNGAPVPFYDFDHRGGSAIYASAHDLVRFGMFHLKDRVPGQKAILSDATLDAMHAATAGKAEDGYGVGWGSGSRFGLKTLGHTGGMAGVSTRLTLFPEKDIAVVLLANADSSRLRELENGILHVLLPETIPLAHGYEPTKDFIGAWTGQIETHAGRTPMRLEIKADGHVLARVGGRASEVEKVRVAPDGTLWLEEVPGDVGTPDAARYPYRLQFGLRARGEVLNGSASAMSRPLTGRVGNAISYFVELRRDP